MKQYETLGEFLDDVSDLYGQLKSAWCKETSADPDNWTPENPAYGQCAVSSLIVQDKFGGNLRRCKVNGVTAHYYNEVDHGNGTYIDMTREQFGHIYDEGEFTIRDREYVLSFPSTVERYELLKERMGL